MFSNCQNDLESQKALYNGTGNKVISVYEKLTSEGKSRAEVISGMVTEIQSIKLTNPTAFKHTADPNIVNTIDIRLTSVQPQSTVNGFINALKGQYGTTVFRENYNNCIHVEKMQSVMDFPCMWQ
jgi:hypothetical protein